MRNDVNTKQELRFTMKAKHVERALIVDEEQMFV
jgi:hypothetical protein